MKRMIALCLAAALLLCSLPLAALAETAPDGTEQPAAAAVQADALTVRGTNAFGTLLAAELNAEADAADAGWTDGCTVTGLVFEGAAARVTFETTVAANLAVAVYTQDGLQLLASGWTAVEPGTTTAVVEIEGEMPDYFYVRAYLLAQSDLSPLCAQYATPMYTQAMQQLLSATVQDYDPSRVLNLDEDETTNFAVYAETTRVITAADGVNVVVSADDATHTYVIENADEQITGLTAGEVFAYRYAADGLLLVKVAQLAVDGTTATITGAPVTMGEVFQTVKIEADAGAEQATMDAAAVGEGITYTGVQAQAAQPAADSPALLAAEGEESQVYAHTFSIDKTVKNQVEDLYLTLKGSLNLGVTVAVKYYVSYEYQYFEATATPRALAHLTVDGGFDITELDLGELTFALLPGVEVGLAPTLTVTITAAVDVDFSVWMTIGFAYESGQGFRNLSTAPQTTLKVDIEGTVTVGLDLCPQVQLLWDAVKAGLNTRADVVVTAVMQGTDFEEEEADGDSRHGCAKCLDGDAEVTLSAGAWVEFLEWEDMSYSYKFPHTLNTGLDFYYSLDYDELAWGGCPHREYKVVATVTRKETFADGTQQETLVTDAAVTLTDMESEELTTYTAQTNANGAAVFWRSNGNVQLRATVQGVTASQPLEVKDAGAKASLIVEIVYTEDGTVDEEQSGGTYVGDLSVFIQPEEAEDYGAAVTAQGGCGSGVYWTLYDDGLLRIYGSGTMGNYGNGDLQLQYTSPWHPRRGYTVKSVKIEEGVTSIGVHAFNQCSELTEIEIPSNIKSIGNSAFMECTSLRKVTLHEGLESIGNSAFFNCEALEELILPDTLTSIGQQMAYSCTSLRKVSIPAGVTTFKDNAFQYCKGLTEVVLQDGLTVLGYGAFEDCTALETVTIPGSVSEVGVKAFYGCESLRSVTLCKGITKLKSTAFARTALTEVTIPEGVTEIGGEAFLYCTALQRVSLPDGLLEIEDDAFWGCTALGELQIPESVTLIGARAFREMESLTAITIPASVQSVGQRVFLGCTGLRTAVFMGSAPEVVVLSLDEYVFDGCTLTAYYPAGDVTWTEEVKQQYGGTVTWIPYTGFDADGAPVLAEDAAQAAAVTASAAPSAGGLQLTPCVVYPGSYGTDETTYRTAAFTGLVPGGDYLLLSLKTLQTDAPLAADNLLYIAQGTADADGNLSFRYLPRVEVKPCYTVACGPAVLDLADAQITAEPLAANGAEQPVRLTVVYNGVTLTEGVDYRLAGQVSAAEPGSYTCTVRGIRNYTGAVSVTYTVVRVMPGDVDLNGVVDVADALTLANALAQKTTLTAPQEQAARLNDDNVVDIRDLTLLMRYLVGAVDGLTQV